MTITLTPELNKELTALWDSGSPQLTQFKVWHWLSRHGIDPRLCLRRETKVVVLEGALPEISIKD